MIDFNKLKPRTGPVIPSPLVPEDGLYLEDYGIGDGYSLFLTPSPVTRKFTRCFQEVWSHIPERDRRTLKEFGGRTILLLRMYDGRRASCSIQEIYLHI